MNEPRPDLIRSQEAFYEFLDSLGLPHTQTIREIRERHGVSKSKYYSWPEIQISPAKSQVKPMLPSQVGFFHFNDDRSPDLVPPEMFTAHFTVGSNARENHAHTLLELERIFGEPSAETSVSNTVAHHWRFGHAVMDIVTWPQDLNKEFANNESWMNFPELRSFTHLYIKPGHLPQATQREVEWMESVQPLAFGHDVHVTSVTRDSFGVNAGLFRWHQDLQAKTQLGLSADGQALVGVFPTLFLILEMTQALELELVRLEPARGSGGSTLYLHYEDAYSTARTRRSVSIVHGDRTESLDDLAKQMGERLKLPLVSKTHLDD